MWTLASYSVAAPPHSTILLARRRWAPVTTPPTWLDWRRLDEHRDIFRFFKTMIAFRKAHPSLSRSRYWRENVQWYGTGAHVDLSDDAHSLAYCLHGASQGDQDIYVLVNADWEPRVFTIQEGAGGDWSRVVDTSLMSPHDIAAPGEEVRLEATHYTVGPRSVVVLLHSWPRYPQPLRYRARR